MDKPIFQIGREKGDLLISDNVFITRMTMDLCQSIFIFKAIPTIATRTYLVVFDKKIEIPEEVSK